MGMREIHSVLNEATFSELSAGKNWYNTAQSQAQALSFKHNVRIDQAAGVLAVLSPAIDWDLNVVAADICIEAAIKGMGPDDVVTPGYPRNKVKAFQIIQDRDLSQVRGLKVEAFYQNILGRTDIVTIDRWAYRIWAGTLTNEKDDLFNRNQKRMTPQIQQDYVALAHSLNMKPAHLQAITWVTARRLAGAQESI